MKRVRQILFTALAIGLFFGMIPLRATAAELSGVYVSGQQLNYDTYYLTNADGTITTTAEAGADNYNVFLTKDADNSQNILTLNNATIQGVASVENGAGISYSDYYEGYSLDIILIGENTVTAADTVADYSFGIYVSSRLTINGDGLTVESKNANIDSCGIFAVWELSISSGTINAVAGDAVTNSCGIGTNETIIISGTNTSVTAMGGNASNGNSSGIASVSGKVEISGGTVKAYGKTAAASDASDTTTGISHGIGAVGGVTISGGTITANAYTTDADTANYNSYGIGSEGTITISGGTIVANGGLAVNGESFGIGATGDFDISGAADIQAKGGNASKGSSYGIGIANTHHVNPPAPGDTSQPTGGSMTVDGETANVKAEGGPAPLGKSLGVGTTDNVSVNEGTLYGKGGEGSKGSGGIVVGGSLTVSGAVDGTAGDSEESVGVGVKGKNGDDNSIIINGGSLSGTAGNSSGTDMDSMGIAAEGNIIVNNGSLNGTGGDSSNGRSLGVASFKNIYVQDGDVTGQGGSADTDSMGVGGNGDVTFVDSIVNATGGIALRSSYGIGSDGNLSINGGTVKLSGGTCGTNGISFGGGAQGALNLTDSNLQAFGNTGALGGKTGFTNSNSNTYKLFVGNSVNEANVWNNQNTISLYKYVTNTSEFCTITFVAGEGTGTMNPYMVIKNVAVTLPANGFDAPANKIFDCWMIDDAEYAQEDEYTASGNVTVTAQWKYITYEVTYDAGGGTGTMSTEAATAGQEFTLPANGFTAPEGKKFKAWSIGGTEYAPGAAYTFTEATTVKAVWEDLEKYTVLYEANGGTGSMNSAEVFIGSTYNLADCTFVAPENQKFKAWQIGETTYAEGAQITVTADVTVKALWEDITYVVSYDANGGSGTMTDAIATSGKEFTLPICGFMAAEDMQFKAWDVNGTKYQAGDKVTFTANTTIKAVWERVSPIYSMTSIVPPVFEGSGTVVATSDGEFSEFRKVEIDGNEIRKDVDYTAVSGSTIVTLQEEYLKTLAVGQHEVKIIFVDGEVSGNFEVKEAVKPTTTPEVTATPAPTTTPEATETPTQKPTQKPADAPAPTAAPTAAPTETPTQTHVSPKTGAEDMSMALAIVVMILAASGMVACVKKK